MHVLLAESTVFHAHLQLNATHVKLELLQYQERMCATTLVLKDSSTRLLSTKLHVINAMQAVKLVMGHLLQTVFLV